jgi:hypothetical protein
MMMMAFGSLEGYRIQHTKEHGSARKLRTLTTRVNGRSHGLIIQSLRMIQIYTY